VKFNFVVNHQEDFPIGLMCELLKVAKSSYYAYVWSINKDPSRRERENAIMLEKIEVLFHQSKGLYGSPRIHASLKRQGDACSLSRVKRLMRQAGLYAVNARKYKPKAGEIRGD
jgi:hypothetical protein